MIGRRTIPARRERRARRVLALLAVLGGLVAPRPARALLPLANASGEALYLRECAPCHGPAGHGDGPEAAIFRNTPRDFGDLARTEPSPRIVERVRRSRMRMLEIDEDAIVERRKRITDDVVPYLRRMPDVPWPQVHRGADVYAERCEKCHGPNAHPVATSVLQRAAQPGGSPPVPDFQKAHDDKELLGFAQGQGHPAVPGFLPVMREDDAHALVAFLHNLSDGFVAYSLWCAGCHGDEGRGDGPLATGIDKPPVEFNHVYVVSQKPDELRRKAMHLFTDVEPTAPHFQRNLSEGQARALLSAVRALQGDGGIPAATGAIAAPAATGAPLATPHAAAATPMPATAPAAVAALPAAVATMRAPGAVAVTPARPSLADGLATDAPASASGASPAAAAPVATPASSAATPAPPTTPAPTASRAPAASRTPAVKSAKPKPAAAKAPAKKVVKPKATPKPAKKAKPKAVPTAAKKAAAPRPTATPDPVPAP